MFGFWQEKTQEQKNRALIKSLFEPRTQFITETKTIFLLHVSQELSNGSTNTISHRAFYIRYGIAFAIVMLIVQGSTIAYASTSDVGPTHPLYTMKRMGEVIQLQFTLTQNKPDLHKTLAHRRLKEIREIGGNNDVQQIIVLSNDFTNEIRETMPNTDGVSLGIQERSKLCNEVLADIRYHEELFPQHSDRWQHIRVSCGEPATTTAL